PAPMKFNRGLLSWVMILALLVMLFFVLSSHRGGREIPTWQEFIRYVQQGEIVDNHVTIKADRITAQEIAPVDAEQQGTMIYVRIDPDNRDWYYDELKNLTRPAPAETDPAAAVRESVPVKITYD